MVLDLDMPDLGGLEVTEFVRADERSRTLPILVVTARSDDVSRKTLLDAGASSFLTKPFAPQQLLEEALQLVQDNRAVASKLAVT
jgi:two-component system chemotaxis response regulator CheY